jgi:hypothetical protein
MPETTPLPPARSVFHKVGQNLYRLESSETYYALFKRTGKQIRRLLTGRGKKTHQQLTSIGGGVVGGQIEQLYAVEKKLREQKAGSELAAGGAGLASATGIDTFALACMSVEL